ncbi:isobutyryl-CoA dehydrogenase [Thalassobaculum salexigens]|uniref:isobutyryl-CoA dehydrogenase n=1 Tax=Thalassobaculum salexigens TaxID=455360 RepID=UPI0003FC3B8A|nr:isobutyryl-CoA dehydrogenase [Thalassobaculum salexigens]
MDFQLNEEQRAIQDMARSFAAERLTPNAAEWDETAHFPVDVLKDLAELGLGAIYVRDDVGGSGLGRLDAAIAFEELSAGCVSTAAFLSIHNMVAWMVDSYGSDEIRQRFLPKLATMEQIASYCLTEPGAGSDAAALKTRAEKVGNSHYVLNGGKAFISGGGTSDVYAVMCRTGEEGAKGISCILVEKDTPGLSFGENEKKLGWNSQPTAMVNFDDCKVPAENLVGSEGQGFRIAMAGLDGGRINIAACSLGGARAALEASLAYVKDRKAFGQAIADFQATQFRLADMATELEASRLMVHRAATSLDAKSPEATQHAAMAKRFATDICYRIVDEALQLHGGYGYLRDYPIERLLRDLRVHRILEGTNEIMRVIIARKLLAN